MRLYWRLGLPGWRIAAAMGVPIKITISVAKDDDANVYIAVSDNIGLAVEAESLDDLMTEIQIALHDLLEVAGAAKYKPTTDIRLDRNPAMV